MTTPSSSTEWNGPLYAEHSAHHRMQDEAFLATFAVSPSDTIIDLGCGTGEFTNKLAERTRSGRVVGVDASSSQLERARALARSNVELRLGRLQELDRLLGDERFDAAVSRATLHWLAKEEHPSLLRAVRDHLRPGGILRCEFGGHGQMRAALALLDEVAMRHGGPLSPWYFPRPDEYEPMLERAGFERGPGFVRLLPQRRAMPTLDRLIGFLNSQAFVGYEPFFTPERFAAFRAEVEARAPEALRREDGSYDLDFVRMDVLVVRR